MLCLVEYVVATELAERHYLTPFDVLVLVHREHFAGEIFECHFTVAIFVKSIKQVSHVTLQCVHAVRLEDLLELVRRDAVFVVRGVDAHDHLEGLVEVEARPLLNLSLEHVNVALDLNYLENKRSYVGDGLLIDVLDALLALIRQTTLELVRQVEVTRLENVANICECEEAVAVIVVAQYDQLGSVPAQIQADVSEHGHDVLQAQVQPPILRRLE